MIMWTIADKSRGLDGRWYVSITLEDGRGFLFQFSEDPTDEQIDMVVKNVPPLLPAEV